MKKILALMVTGVAVASVAMASGTGLKAKKGGNEWTQGTWSIRAFYGFVGGDAKDDVEIDSVYGAGLEYTLPPMNGGGTGLNNVHLGVEWNTSSQGLGDTKMDNYGFYVGTTFPIAQGQMSGLEVLLNAGYYNTKFHDGGFDEDKWGFGFDAGFRYKFSKAAVELFYRMRPEVDSISNNAIVIGVNFPFGGK